QHGRHPRGLHGLSLVRARGPRPAGVEAPGSLVATPRRASGLPKASDAAVDLSPSCRARRLRRTTPPMHVEPFRIAVPDAVRAHLGGLGIHFIHARGTGPAPLPLVITHGWPGSVAEFAEIIGPLADPARHGGDPADAFEVVAPSMPGYGFSDHPTEPGMDPER